MKSVFKLSAYLYKTLK